MSEFEIPDMTCGHCAGVITRAIQAAAPGAKVEIDIPNHRVHVEAGPNDETLVTVIREAGYTPKAV